MLDDSYVDDILDEQGDSKDWYKSEIFRIYGCKTLRLKLRSGRDSLADYFHEKLLIIEDIDNLELQEFEVGRLPSTSNYGTVS